MGIILDIALGVCVALAILAFITPGFVRDWHSWRGFAWERDLFHWRLTVGVLTLMLCRFCVTDRLALIAKTIGEVKDKLEGK